MKFKNEEWKTLCYINEHIYFFYSNFSFWNKTNKNTENILPCIVLKNNIQNIFFLLKTITEIRMNSNKMKAIKED